MLTFLTLTGIRMARRADRDTTVSREGGARPEPDDRRQADAPDAAPVRVFIVDDHAVVRDGLRFQFELDAGFVVVGEAGTVAAAREGILRARPDVAIVDVRLPDGSGIELVRDVRSVDAGIASIMFTSHPADTALFQSVLAGAVGYLVKDASTQDIHDAVRVAASGGSLVDRTTLDDLRSIPMAEDARLAFRVGLAVAEMDDPPGWKPGDEFEAVRQRMEAEAAAQR